MLAFLVPGDSGQYLVRVRFTEKGRKEKKRKERKEKKRRKRKKEREKEEKRGKREINYYRS